MEEEGDAYQRHPLGRFSQRGFICSPLCVLCVLCGFKYDFATFAIFAVYLKTLLCVLCVLCGFKYDFAIFATIAVYSLITQKFNFADRDNILIFVVLINGELRNGKNSILR